MSEGQPDIVGSWDTLSPEEREQASSALAFVQGHPDFAVHIAERMFYGPGYLLLTGWGRLAKLSHTSELEELRHIRSVLDEVAASENVTSAAVDPRRLVEAVTDIRTAVEGKNG